MHRVQAVQAVQTVQVICEMFMHTFGMTLSGRLKLIKYHKLDLFGTKSKLIFYVTDKINYVFRIN